MLVRFLRFRLGCHHVRIHTGRWLLPVLPHSQRTCLRCSSTVVDDEAHCLFMCEHPTIVEARDLFLAAVVPPVAALSSLRYADFWALSGPEGGPEGGPAPWAYYSPAAAYVLHSGDQGSVVRRERSAPSGWGHRPRRPSPGIPPAHGGSSSHRRMRPESRRRQEQQASPVCTAPANLRNLAA